MPNNPKPTTYREAGVDIEKGDRFVAYIQSLKSKAILKSLGGFSGGLELDLKQYQQPVLLSCTDGVGTKLLVAQKLNRYDTLGIDLVAMNVNDLIVCGAKPLCFLDYIALGSIQEKLMQDLIKGIVAGCEDAECVLAGGETAEMPDVYGPTDFDLAGFAVGIAEKNDLLPRLNSITRGDPVLGLASSGIHSNGLSLARKVIPEKDRRAWELLLTPTRIYVRDFFKLMPSGLIQAAAHITGSGLEGNLLRVIPEGMQLKLTWDWEVPEIFDLIQQYGSIDKEEMRQVFNMGIGLALICKKADCDKLLGLAKAEGLKLVIIGEVA